MKGGILISNQPTRAWREYEDGKRYKNRLGLYETVRRNERFYRGDQWQGCTADLPHPVFNLVRRITDYLVSSILTGNISIRYSDDALPFIKRAAERQAITHGIQVLNKNAAWRWKQGQMEALSYRALLDAAISGDGVFYCWWDPLGTDGQAFLGDIRTDLVDSTNLFVADPTSSELQRQAYVILSCQTKTEDLRREAQAAGLREEALARILPDGTEEPTAGVLASHHSEENTRTTYLLKFYREHGEVICEKSVKDLVISRIHTGLKHYPIAYFHWHDSKNCYLGSAPVSDLIANQTYINTAYAMAMKHMSDTAFSKVIYDKSRIPEWSNEVGEAIAAVGGGNVADAVSVVGVGKLQDGYLQLIENVIENTKSMMGATEAALGDAAANNTSAILTLQTASRIALEHVRGHFHKCISDLATIWADMLCTYCPNERLLITETESGEMQAEALDYALCKHALLRATATAEQVDRYTPSATVSILDKLLEHGALGVREYLELLPSGVISDREALLRKILQKGIDTNE